MTTVKKKATVKKGPGQQIMKQGFDRMKGGDKLKPGHEMPNPGISTPARPKMKLPQKPFPINFKKK